MPGDRVVAEVLEEPLPFVEAHPSQPSCDQPSCKLADSSALSVEQFERPFTFPQVLLFPIAANVMGKLLASKCAGARMHYTFRRSFALN